MFAAALASLATDDVTLVYEKLGAWKAGACGQYRQIAVNIEAETALAASAFAGLLSSFVEEFARCPKPEEAWVAACRRHQFAGAVLPAPVPARLGRAIPIANYADIISRAGGSHLSPDQCEVLLREVSMAGPAPHRRLRAALQAAPIGRHVIWATFCAAHPGDCPFDHLPRTTEAVRTALGLGGYAETETLVLISYGSTLASGPLALHRPTIADAADYSWYRPAPPAATYGSTFPLPPNPSGIAPQPEVVHRETTGETLVFPVYLVT